MEQLRRICFANAPQKHNVIIVDNVPLSDGNISSSRFIVMLKREEECRLSFLVMGPCTAPAVNFSLFRGVGGGALTALFALGCNLKVL